MNPSFAKVIAPMLGRRSIRAFRHREIPNESVQALLEAAMAAPSAAARDPWRFVVLRSPQVRARVAEGLPHGRLLGSAGVGFVVGGDWEAALDGEVSYLLQDCSAAVENLLIAAQLLGLGAVWLGIHPRLDCIEHVRRVLSIPEHVLPIAGVAVGYPDELRPARSRYSAQHVHVDRW